GLLDAPVQLFLDQFPNPISPRLDDHGTAHGRGLGHVGLLHHGLVPVREIRAGAVGAVDGEGSLHIGLQIAKLVLLVCSHKTYPNRFATKRANMAATRPFSGFEWMVAMRYLKPRRKEAFVSVISILSLVGIALGVATLIIVMSVMNG